MENQNYIKLQILIKEANKLGVSIFKEKWENQKGQAWVDNEKNGKLIYKLLQSPKLTKIQKKLLLNGSSSEWDINLLVQIFESFLPSSDGSLLNSFKEIKKIRNEWAHNSKMEISANDYEKHLKNLKKVFISCGLSEDELEKTINDYFGELSKKKPNINEAFNKMKEKANEKFQANNYFEALEIYSSALKCENINDQDRAIIYCNKSNCYINLYLQTKSKEEDFLSDALHNAKTSLGLNPSYIKAYFRIGKIYEEKKKISKSLNFYSKVLAFDPANKEIIEKVAKLKIDLGTEQRTEHLMPNYQSKTHEEDIKSAIQKTLERTGIGIGSFELNFEEMCNLDPSLSDFRKADEYRLGSRNCKQNSQMAAQYYSKAADKGNVEALFFLGQMTMDGDGVSKNTVLALKFMEKAANSPPIRMLGKMEIRNAGVADAQHALGLCYQDGVGVPKNMNLSIKWYEKAVSNGNGRSANNLGNIYMNGIDLELDYEKAEQMFLFAYEKGSEASMKNLTLLYIKMDYPEKALIWHERCKEKIPLYYLPEEEIFGEQINSSLKEFEKKGISKWEQKMKLSTHNMNHPQRIQRFNEYNDLKNKDFVKKKNILATTLNLSQNNPIKCRFITFNLQEIQEYSDKGSKTAKNIMIAFNYALEAFEIIKKGNENNYPIIITLLSKAIRTEYTIIELNTQSEIYFLAILNEVRKSLKKNEVSISNRDARLCYIFLNLENYEDNLIFIDE